MASDIEMGDDGSNQQSDVDSLKSTAPSEPADEYDVEEILAERKFRGKTQYLVKWLGYPMHRSDWEPRVNLDAPEILAKWARAKVEIKAKKRKPFDVDAFEEDLKRREDETKARKKSRQARRIQRDKRLKSIIKWSDDDDSNHCAQDPQGGEGVDDIDDLFVSASSKDESSSSCEGSPAKSPDATSITSGQPPTGTAETPINITETPATKPRSSVGATRASPERIQATTGVSQAPIYPTQDLQGRPKASLGVSQAPQKTIQPAAATFQSVRNSTQPTHSPNSNSKASQGAARKTSASMKLSSNGTKKINPHPPSNLPGFGNASLAPGARNAAHHVNTKWLGRGSRWGRDRAPDASELQLLKPAEFTPLKNPQVKPPPITTQFASEQSSRLGDMTPGNPNPSSTRPTDSQQLPTTDNPMATCLPWPDHAPRNPRSMDPDIGVPRLSGQAVGRDFSSRVSNPSRPVPENHGSLGQLPTRRSIQGLNRPFGTGPLETQLRRDPYRQSDHLWNRSKVYHNRSPSPPSSPSRKMPAQADDFRRNSIPTRTPTSGAHTKSHRMNPRDEPPSAAARSGHALNEIEISEKEELSRMPVSIRTPDSHGPRGALPHGHFWNPGEVYAHVFYGPDKTPVGAVRLCGISFEARRDLTNSRAENSIWCEMWFKDLCNEDQYAELCQKASRNSAFGNCWMEGFQDTNPGLLRMAHYLRRKNVMAIFYPQDPKGDVWLAFSRASPDFDFLDLKLDTQKVPNGTPLLLSVRAALPPFSSLPAFEDTPNDMGALISDDPFAGVEKSTDSTPHIQQVTNVPQSQETGALAASMLTNQDKEGIVKSFFASTLKTSINDLNRLSDSSTAENFFLFFPPEEGEEFQIMQRWLSWNNMTVYSNRDNNGWSRFMDNGKRGVVIFHESFSEIHSQCPGIAKLMMGEVFNFWSVRLYRKLEWPDPHGLCTNDHFQPLFPRGGLILLAEDIFQDLKKTTILIYWFLHFPQRKDWKLVLPPDAWKRLQGQLQQAKDDEETKFLLSIIVSIKKINSIDERYPYFQENSLRPSEMHEPNSNIVSLPIAGYGSRSEDDYPAIPKGLSQQERDMDHLAEAFAGWTLTKSACFRRMIILSSVQSPPLRERWRSWGHIILLESDDFFTKFKVREHVIMESLLKERRLSQTANSPAETTPGTPATPADPPVDADPSDSWKRPSEIRQSGSYR